MLLPVSNDPLARIDRGSRPDLSWLSPATRGADVQPVPQRQKPSKAGFPLGTALQGVKLSVEAAGRQAARRHVRPRRGAARAQSRSTLPACSTGQAGGRFGRRGLRQQRITRIEAPVADRGLLVSVRGLADPIQPGLLLAFTSCLSPTAFALGLDRALTIIWSPRRAQVALRTDRMASMLQR